jgi:DNA-binding GntR family transcriptional regulator
MVDLVGAEPRPRLAAIQRPTLHEEIVVRLRTMILDGDLAPGAWIAEMKLCQDLGVSRTPLREALKVLAFENLITLLPNRGAVVTEVRVEEIAELFEIMDALEALVGRLAVERGEDGQIAELQSMHSALAEHHRKGRRAVYFELNQAIHQKIADLSGNQSLADTYSGFAGKIKRARYLANLSDARWAQSLLEHEEFMAALAGRDANLFASLLQEHSRRTGAVVCAKLRELASARPGTGLRSKAAPAKGKGLDE